MANLEVHDGGGGGDDVSLVIYYL